MSLGSPSQCRRTSLPLLTSLYSPVPVVDDYGTQDIYLGSLLPLEVPNKFFQKNPLQMKLTQIFLTYVCLTVSLFPDRDPYVYHFGYSCFYHHSFIGTLDVSLSDGPYLHGITDLISTVWPLIHAERTITNFYTVLTLYLLFFTIINDCTSPVKIQRRW